MRGEGRDEKGGEGTSGKGGEGRGEEAFLVMWSRRLSAFNPPLARGLPPFQGTSVRPSGRFPSDRTKPCGSGYRHYYYYY